MKLNLDYGKGFEIILWEFLSKEGALPFIDLFKMQSIFHNIIYLSWAKLYSIPFVFHSIAAKS